MICLSLDSTTRDGSVALVVDDRIVEERRGDGSRSHGERLPRELLDVAAAHGVAIADVEVFAVAAGPGSFTGLRIGIATVQGLAFVERRMVVAVSALEAAAHAAAERALAGTIVAAWIDAQRQDVYASSYRVADALPYTPERLTPLAAPMVGDPAHLLEGWRSEGAVPRVFVGDGAVRYAEVVRRGVPGAELAAVPLLAGPIGRVAIVRAGRGEAVHPAAIQPLYVRRPDAVVDRERNALGRS